MTVPANFDQEMNLTPGCLPAGQQPWADTNRHGRQNGEGGARFFGGTKKTNAKAGTLSAQMGRERGTIKTPREDSRPL